MKDQIESNEEVKKFVELQKSLFKLEEQKRKLSPMYYKNVVQSCNHLFATCSHKLYEWEVGNTGATDYSKHTLIIDHYCLRCGLTTAYVSDSIIEQYGIQDTSTAILQRYQHLEIIKKVERYFGIGFGEFNIVKLIGLWKNIKDNNPSLSETEQIELLKSKVVEIKSKQEINPKK
ncbi:MAG: hypothetical protein Q4P14_02080, partial [Methanobacteriaceae archaeon]|nr:hypothetical protein [Methanobacteriaceae archaeon]